MRKITLTILLSLTLTISGFAGGIIPISGFTGCENGLYYPDTGECIAGLAAVQFGRKTRSGIFGNDIDRGHSIFSRHDLLICSD